MSVCVLCDQESDTTTDVRFTTGCPTPVALPVCASCRRLTDTDPDGGWARYREKLPWMFEDDPKALRHAKRKYPHLGG